VATIVWGRELGLENTDGAGRVCGDLIAEKCVSVGGGRILLFEVMCLFFETYFLRVDFFLPFDHYYFFYH
jgi:hypothetical protein